MVETTTTDQVADAPSHPAKFSAAVLDVLNDVIPDHTRVLDPFAGTGKIHELSSTRDTVGVELEPEWANMHARTMVGDATSLPFEDEEFDVIATSPCYGNRMADHHDARDGSKRITYRHKLGRELSANNSGKLQWGMEYRLFHATAWNESIRVLRRRGLFVLNISNHIRAGVEQRVAEWHVDYLVRRCELTLRKIIPVFTDRMKYGENYDARVGCEFVFVMEK